MTVVEASLAGTVRLWFPDQDKRFLLVLVLLGMLMLTVLLVFYLVIRYPHELMARFDRVTEAIKGQLSDFEREALVRMYSEGRIEYTETTKNDYKSLRNRGLARTPSGKPMRKDTSLVPTELGKLIVHELRRA